MRAELKSRYDATRDFSGKKFRSACYAPFTSLYFDTYGGVRVCCHNVAHLVGDISKDTIDSIWTGKSIRTLRKAIACYDFSCGCQFCEWRLSLGSFSSLTMKGWDQFAIKARSPKWPQMMEFSISNTCNLECVMCAGYASSAIRANREKLPPLAKAYHDAFFIQLEKYLPHLHRAKFLGGEPFLQRECFRIWEAMIRQGLRIPCHATTNGTQWNATVERILSKLPFELAISMDGFTKRTVESIRIHVVYETLLANFRAFHAYARENKTGISLTFCLMRQNWRELGEFCAFADEWDCPVFVNTVKRPPECSLFTLSANDLKQIVEEMEKEASSLLPKLKMNGAVWLGELERLRSIVRLSPSSGPLNILPYA
jgi:MoaA/NifB/PqqE/SkfB family radical SAM enzyme